MDFNSISGGQETLCIKVNKVYDWVTRQVDVPLLAFTGATALPTLGFDCGAIAPTPTPGFDDPCAFLGGTFTVECFPTDEEGTPIDPLAPGAILCQEIPQPEGRATGQFQLPDGSTVTLQKVKVLKKGFVVVRVSNPQGEVCQSAPIAWAVAEKFFLCAPPGTFLQCEITDFECDANLICQRVPGTPGEFAFQQLDISINLCQNVQMEALVKLEITADFCQPRPDMPFVCPPLAFPPQCPTVFPGPGPSPTPTP
ncbi:hypothetical protein [Metabacillus sediminilitoris]|uniref:Uncharacterized protein n=1 Tax=Metabacillus sediminilitoris TaxID=2567941 RepID=A0A4S4BV14_9BACI|nr:hypothetical protein [Metabacillus sediminilitoris]QGQ44706.1 hypothetical protein GMB29_05135 [Metabacillus sediminilitoris]THF78946.1 hypothetical protein E6W99_14595 [Metabacillus sediminilitoris]